jgi:ADP-ribose pyrophosphatase
VTADFARAGERIVYEGRVITLAVGSFLDPNGQSFERDVVHHPGAVAVVALTDDHEVVLVRQYRAPLDQTVLELPAGIRDVDGEDPATTAARELAEETGLAAEHMELLCRFHNSPGFADEEVLVYLATVLTAVPPSTQGVEEEHMTVERILLHDAVEAISDGTITDGKTIIGLLMTEARLNR